MSVDNFSAIQCDVGYSLLLVTTDSLIHLRNGVGPCSPVHVSACIVTLFFLLIILLFFALVSVRSLISSSISYSSLIPPSFLPPYLHLLLPSFRSRPFFSPYTLHFQSHPAIYAFHLPSFFFIFTFVLLSYSSLLTPVVLFSSLFLLHISSL